MTRPPSRRPAAPPPVAPVRRIGVDVWTVAAVVLFVATRLWLVTAFEPRSSDVGLYFQYADRAARQHEVAFRDFSIEYPPLAWWTMAGAYGLAQGADPARMAAPDADTRFVAYREAFRTLMSRIDIVAAVVMLLLLRRVAGERSGLLFATYVIATAALPHVLYDRLDLELWLWLVGWAYCLSRASEDAPAEVPWAIGSYACLGAAIAYKLAPVVGVPILLLAEWRHPRRDRLLASTAAGLAIGLGLPFAIQMASSGLSVFGFLSFYFDRPLQIESLCSTLVEVASLVGAPLTLTRTASGFNLEGTVASACVVISTIATLLLIAGLLWMGLRRSATAFPHRRAYGAAMIAIAGTTILAKVLSPQFMIWALPLLLLLAAEDTRPSRERLIAVCAAVVLIAAATTWIFPYHYFVDDTTTVALVPRDLAQGLPASPWAFVVVALRNVGFLGVLALVSRRAGLLATS